MVGVDSLDLQGNRIDETIVIEAKGEAKSGAPFLIVDTVICAEGSVSVAWRYPLGRADNWLDRAPSTRFCGGKHRAAMAGSATTLSPLVSS